MSCECQYPDTATGAWQCGSVGQSMPTRCGCECHELACARRLEKWQGARIVAHNSPHEPSIRVIASAAIPPDLVILTDGINTVAAKLAVGGEELCDCGHGYVCAYHHPTPEREPPFSLQDLAEGNLRRIEMVKANPEEYEYPSLAAWAGLEPSGCTWENATIAETKAAAPIDPYATHALADQLGAKDQEIRELREEVGRLHIALGKAERKTVRR